MRGFLLALLAGMRRESVIERRAIDVLGVIGKMAAHRRREVGIVPIGHADHAPRISRASRAPRFGTLQIQPPDAQMENAVEVYR